jgi:hypothetical protein
MRPAQWFQTRKRIDLFGRHSFTLLRLAVPARPLSGGKERDLEGLFIQVSVDVLS